MTVYREQALPETLSHFKDTSNKGIDDPWQVAYKTCLQYEARAESRVDCIRSRVLGYSIRETPCDESRDTICRDINSCNGEHGKLRDIADLYIRSFLRVFLSSRKPTPSHSQHPSRPSFDNLRDSLKEDLQPTPRTTSREQALRRDNFRCVVTNTYSLDMYEKVPNPSQSTASVGPLEVAHILPRSINDGISTSEGKQNEAAQVWAVMQRFGRISPKDLNGDQVHRLENVITLWDTVHTLFDRLEVWFEPSDNDPYECLVKTSVPRDVVPYLSQSFTLTTADPNLPRPSPDYLRLHATCARVANLSGATEYVASMYRDLNDQRVLANDGSSAMVLQAMLSTLVH